MTLTVIVPSRSRPSNAARLIEAWEATCATAELLFAVDRDDPTFDDYVNLGADMVTLPKWKPMCEKLNEVATAVAPRVQYVGFMGDDHLPHTSQWDALIVDELERLQLGIVYPNDWYQGSNLPTSVFMDAVIVRRLGWMVPPGIEHLYCDNAWLEIGKALGTLRYLPDVIVEHLHPHARKADFDAQYERVNSCDQTTRDREAFDRWRYTALETDVRKVTAC